MRKTALTACLLLCCGLIYAYASSTGESGGEAVGASECFTDDVILAFSDDALDAAGLMLVMRQTGFHEKALFYELHPVGTDLDSCGDGPEPLDKVQIAPPLRPVRQVEVVGNAISVSFGKGEVTSLEELVEAEVAVSPR